MRITIRNLSKSFNGTPVIDSLFLDLPDRGVIGLSGPSGCGKTTLLRLLAGLEMPDRGQIEGIDLHKISMVFQEDRLLPWLSALGNLMIAQPDHDQALAWLAKVQLDGYAGYYPAEMSGGMKRRVALARALAFPSELLLLDEPFLGVDNERRTILHELVRSTAKERLVILVTHDATDLASLADRVLDADGPPLQIRDA